MAHLVYFTDLKVEELRASVEERLDWYYDPTTELKVSLSDKRRADLETKSLRGRLAANSAEPHKDDAQNALTVYSAMSSLTRHQAIEERLWAYLCHVEVPKYVKSRWLAKRPSSDAESIRKVVNHFFVSGIRGVVRDNAVSRLWWLGYIANQADPANPSQFLEIVLHRLDVRSALLERPFVSTNKRVLRAIYGVMREQWNLDPERRLFRRKIFRDWMIALNRRGGVVLIDALSNARLSYVVKKEAELVLGNEES